MVSVKFYFKGRKLYLPQPVYSYMTTNTAIKFDDLPQLIIYELENRPEIRTIIIEKLSREIKYARRPWGPIEPFIEALYHSTFVMNDIEISKLLHEYLEKVYVKYKNYYTKETQEILEIVLKGAWVKLGKSSIENAEQSIKSIQTTSIYSELVKALVLTEISGEFKNEINEILSKILKNNDPYKLKELINRPEGKKIIETFHLYYDLDLITETRPNLSPYNYFIHRAQQLINILQNRKQILEDIERDIKELESKLKMYRENLINKAQKGVNYVSKILIFLSFTVSIMLLIPGLSEIIAAFAGGVFIFIVDRFLRKILDILNLLLIKLILFFADFKYRNLRKEIKYKKKCLEELEKKVRKLR